MPDRTGHPKSLASSIDVREFANLARVPEDSQDAFCKMVEEAIDIARRETVLVRKVPRIEGRDAHELLLAVRAAAKNLDQALVKLEGPHDRNKPGLGLAVVLLDLALSDNDPDAPPSIRSLRCAADHRSQLKILTRAAIKAAERVEHHFPPRPRGRPPGVGGNPAFNNFVGRLYEIARMTGGKWAHYRDRTSASIMWKGNLMPALEMLRPHLPLEGFFPDTTTLGYVLEHLSNWDDGKAAKNSPPN